MVLIGLAGAGAPELKTFEVVNPVDLFWILVERSKCPVWRWGSNIYMMNFFTVLVSAPTGAPYVSMATTGSPQLVCSYQSSFTTLPLSMSIAQSVGRSFRLA